jgi:hypothetical protein
LPGAFDPAALILRDAPLRLGRTRLAQAIEFACVRSRLVRVVSDRYVFRRGPFAPFGLVRRRAFTIASLVHNEPSLFGRLTHT